MKVKLIQTGGFMGKTKFAEADIASLSPQTKQCLDRTFLQYTQQERTVQPPVAGRDQFQYFLEYGDQAMPLQALEGSPEMKALLSDLKSRLHY